MVDVRPLARRLRRRRHHVDPPVRGPAPVPFPTVSDVFWLAYYPFVVAGLVFLIRDRFEGFDLHRWIDGMAAAFIMTTLGLIFVVDPVVKEHKDAQRPCGRRSSSRIPILRRAHARGGRRERSRSRPGDPGRRGFSWGSDCSCSPCADSVSAVQEVKGTIRATTTYDFVWTAGALLIAWAAWRPYPAAPATGAQLTGWKAVALPIRCQILAASIQVLALFRHLPESERAPDGVRARNRHTAALDQPAADARVS